MQQILQKSSTADDNWAPNVPLISLGYDLIEHISRYFKICQ